MKITDIKVRYLEIPFPVATNPTWGHGKLEHCHGMALVEVHTDEGVTGYGAAEAMWGWGGVYKAMILGMLKPRLLGRDPFETERIIMDIRDMPGRPWIVENALWDIIGKTANLPVYKMWGGYQDSVQAYAALGGLDAPEKLAEDAMALVEKGFKAIKIRLHHKTAARDIEIVAAIRTALGQEITLMADANQATAPYRSAGGKQTVLWGYERALTMARELKDLGVFWLEEPLPLHDYRNLSRLAANTDILISGGEINSGIHEFKLFLDQECYDILQPNCTMAEGMFQIRKIAAMAEVNHKLLIPHSWVQGPGFYANLQIAGAISNCPFIEFPMHPPSIVPENFHCVLTQIPAIDSHGRVHLPDKPGLGVDINWDVVKKYEKTV